MIIRSLLHELRNVDIQKAFQFLRELIPGLSPWDALCFVFLWFGYKRFNNIKGEIMQDVSKQYIERITGAISEMSEAITSIKYELVRHTSNEEAQFQLMRKDLSGSNEFREKLMNKLERIESVQERHTFIFEGQNTEMYANTMHNIKQRAREFFADWKVKMHKRALEIDFNKPVKTVFAKYFSDAMDDLAMWTIEFRKRIHPTHMAIIENEVNPTAIKNFADQLGNKILPKLFEISKDVNFEKKSFDVIDTFLDVVDRAWEELMEMTFRSKRAKGDI